MVRNRDFIFVGGRGKSLNLINITFWFNSSYSFDLKKQERSRIATQTFWILLPTQEKGKRQAVWQWGWCHSWRLCSRLQSARPFVLRRWKVPGADLQVECGAMWTWTLPTQWETVYAKGMSQYYTSRSAAVRPSHNALTNSEMTTPGGRWNWVKSNTEEFISPYYDRKVTDNISVNAYTYLSTLLGNIKIDARGKKSIRN